MQEENFSGEDSLRLINEMMSKVKRSYVTKGTASIVWGALIIICSLVTWAQISFNIDLGFDIWFILLFALVPQIYFSIKERRSKNFTSHDEHTVRYVWGAFAIAIFITSFYNSKFGTKESASLIMMLYGIPTFITGGMFRFKPMIAGGIICWILTVVSVYTNPAADMLLMGASGLFAWLIPGIILLRRYQKQRRENV